MENAEKNNLQKYIVSLDNGIRTEEPIKMEVFNDFSDGSKLVQLNGTVFGVYKSNSTSPETMYIDDYEIIKSDIAELLDVEHEEAKRIVTEDANLGVFTVLNYSKDIETRISSTTIINNVVGYINNGELNKEDAIWISEILKTPSSKENPLKDPKEIEKAIRLGIRCFEIEIEKKSGILLTEQRKTAIAKNYVRMILFDFLIGRKYRGLDYYLIARLTEKNEILWNESYFGPISITSSSSKEELVGEGNYLLNNKFLDRSTLIKVLFDVFYYEIHKQTEALNDATRLYKDAMNRIIYNNTEVDAATYLEDLIMTNLDIIKKLQTAKEKDKSNKINKIERTMATQSINVRVTAKLDLIQKKYPVNPKEHPELIEDLKKKNENPENINLVVEKDNQDNKGFASLAILVSIVALICGVAAGIAYVLITFGN